MAASVKTSQMLAAVLVSHIGSDKSVEILQVMLKLNLNNSTRISLRRIYDEVKFLQGNERKHA